MGRETETQSLAQSRHGGEAIHRPMKKALDLRGVEVHRDDVFDADGFKQIRHDSRADRFSMPVPFVASGISEVRYDGKDGGGRRAAPVHIPESSSPEASMKPLPKFQHEPWRPRYGHRPPSN